MNEWINVIAPYKKRVKCNLYSDKGSVCAQQNSITEPDVKYKWKGEITEVPKGMEGRLEDKKEVVSRNLNINNREK